MISLNVRGLREDKKNRKILDWLSKHGGDAGISFLQETYSAPELENKWKQKFRGNAFFSHGSTHSRGVAILFGDKLDYKIENQDKDNEGRLLLILCQIQGSHYLLINSYFPNEEKNQVEFLKNILKKIEEIDMPIGTSIIWGGDFNFVRNLDLETSGGNPKLKISSIEQLQTILEELDLCDIWRIRNPDLKRYTWRGYGQGRASNHNVILHRRLDFFTFQAVYNQGLTTLTLSQLQQRTTQR